MLDPFLFEENGMANAMSDIADWGDGPPGEFVLPLIRSILDSGDPVLEVRWAGRDYVIRWDRGTTTSEDELRMETRPQQDLQFGLPGREFVHNPNLLFLRGELHGLPQELPLPNEQLVQFLAERLLTAVEHAVGVLVKQNRDVIMTGLNEQIVSLWSSPGAPD